MNWLDEPIGVGGWWNPPTPQPIDVDGNGTVDFSFWGDQFAIFASFRSEDANRYLILPDSPPNIGGLVAALDAGFEIEAGSGGGSVDWFGHTDWAPLMKQYSTERTGLFWGKRAYIGIEFETEDGTHYGWFDVEGDDSIPYAQVHGWAFESTPGMGIIAGAIPEPSSILLFTSGVMSVLFLRARKRIL